MERNEWPASASPHFRSTIVPLDAMAMVMAMTMAA